MVWALALPTGSFWGGPFPQASSPHRSGHGVSPRECCSGIAALIETGQAVTSQEAVPPNRGRIHSPVWGWRAGGTWKNPREAASAAIVGRRSSGPAKISHMIPL